MHFPGIRNYESNELSSTELNAALATPPTSSMSSTTTTIPKYLELICDDETQNQLQPQQQIKHIPAISSHHLQQSQNIHQMHQHQKHHTSPHPPHRIIIAQHSDGYEMPITSTFIPTTLSRSNSHTNSIKNRTFSNSSTVSERISILASNNNNNLLNSNTIDVSNTILKVALPPPSPEPTAECTSMDTLLPNATPPPPSHIQMTHQLSQEQGKRYQEGRTVI